MPDERAGQRTPPGQASVHGWCDPALSRVREVFTEHFASGEEAGAAVCVYLGDELAVDLWGGVADIRTGRPWQRSGPGKSRPYRSRTAAAGWRHHGRREPGKRWRRRGQQRCRHIDGRPVGRVQPAGEDVVQPGRHDRATGQQQPRCAAGRLAGQRRARQRRRARGFYRHLIAGGILSRETLAAAIETRVSGPDRVLGIDSAFGLGFMRPAAAFPVPPPGRHSAFGHNGVGGAAGLGDLTHRMAMAYVPNRMGDEVSGALRAYRLAEAVYASIS